MKSIYDLQPGRHYEVVQEFTDYNNIVHPVGERWTFETTNFLPYEDGLTLHVSHNGVKKMYRLQIRPEEQQALAYEFGRYVTEVAAAS